MILADLTGRISDSAAGKGCQFLKQKNHLDRVGGDSTAMLDCTRVCIYIRLHNIFTLEVTHHFRDAGSFLDDDKKPY